MNTGTDSYQNPLASRYASRDMLFIFSDDNRYATWRDLWIALAEVEAELGAAIAPMQIAEMRRHARDVDYARVAVLERELRHDVMAHIRAYGEQCPSARPIIHLGATSCFVTDNADLILMRQGLDLLRSRIVVVVEALRDLALKHRRLPVLAYTHFQPAQLTTLGKRAALWAQDFVLDLEALLASIAGMRFRGVKGATGTQASFLELFDGDHARVEELDRRVSERMGFGRRFLVTGQTYTRKLDDAVLHGLSSVAQSAHKMTNDLRLLQGIGEVEEPFEDAQVGSSAMPYKRNPMRSERIASLAKFVICEAQNGAWVHATQWFERTLDDSANRRLSIPQTFLAVDAILLLVANVVRGLVVHRDVIDRRIQEHLPYMASEELLMHATRAGGDRQELHERLRVHAIEAREVQRLQGGRSDLLERLAADPLFAPVRQRIGEARDPARYVGRAAEQVEAFVVQEIDPLLASAREAGAARAGADHQGPGAWEPRV